jgi:hypothetical protein
LSEEPWYRRQSYARDLRSVMRGPINTGAIEFARLPGAARERTKVAA